MFEEKIIGKRGTVLRKNTNQELKISIEKKDKKNVFLVNGVHFITKNISKSDLVIEPSDYYMIVNNNTKPIIIKYSLDVSKHQIVYDPYKFEHAKKSNLTADELQKVYHIPENYIDTLPKWYSFKFTYDDFNLIFVKPQLGISFQIHKLRNEFWEILGGKPIIINGNTVHYFVKNTTKLEIPSNTYHSVLNPNMDKFVIIKELWSGHFDEEDITRIFNPNNYQ